MGVTLSPLQKSRLSRESCVSLNQMMAIPLPLWLRGLWEPKDLIQSRKLVQELHLPPSTSQFVYALRPSDAPDSVVYILSSLPLSERSATDARKVIEAAHPKAVVSLVDLRAIESFKEEEKLAGEPFSVPSSTLGVIQEHLERDPDVVPYASRARAQVSRSIFGTGMFSDVLEAKAAASKADASFHYIDFPYRLNAEYGGDDLAMAGIRKQDDGSGVTGDFKKLEGNDDSATMRRVAQGLRSFGESTPLDELRRWRESCSFALAQLFGHQSSKVHAVPPAGRTAAAEVPAEAPPQTQEEDDTTPDFAQPLLPLLSALCQLYQTPALAQAFLCAQKLFQNVEIGREVNPTDVLESSRFRIALEMSRVQANNAIIASPYKVQKRTVADFHDLSYEDKCHAVLAQSLQKQARENGTVVAVLDVTKVPGIRRQWNQPIPEEVISLIDECYISTDEIESNIFETLFSMGRKESNLTEGRKEKKAAVVVGAGAAAAVGLAYLPQWAAPLPSLVKIIAVKASTLFKLSFLNSKRAVALSVAKSLPGASKVVLPLKASAAKTASASAVKAAASADKAFGFPWAQGFVTALQRQTLQAIRTTFYSAMRNSQHKAVGHTPWVMFGCSMIAGGSILFYGDNVERALGAVSTAQDVAKLGRGLESLSEASDKVDLDWNEIYRLVYNIKRNVL